MKNSSETGSRRDFAKWVAGNSTLAYTAINTAPVGIPFAADAIKNLLIRKDETILAKVKVRKSSPFTTPFEGDIVANFPQINKVYMKSLVDRLSSKKEGTPEKNARAVHDNTIVIGNPNGHGTGVRLDESGYYLTVSHNLTTPKNEQSISADYDHGFVFDPKTGLGNEIRGAIFHPELDVAIVYAPTGKKQQPVAGISIDTSPLTPGQDLWQFALMAEFKNGSFDMQRFIMYGKATEIDHILPNRKNLKRIDGMIPFGGASGAPIVNEKGAIVAVESGVYHDGENRYENYKGATVAPLLGLFELLQRDITPITPAKKI